ncbi:MAG: septum formation family protein [Beutenbergiaceae bacterium]
MGQPPVPPSSGTGDPVEQSEQATGAENADSSPQVPARAEPAQAEPAEPAEPAQAAPAPAPESDAPAAWPAAGSSDPTVALPAPPISGPISPPNTTGGWGNPGLPQAAPPAPQPAPQAPPGAYAPPPVNPPAPSYIAPPGIPGYQPPTPAMPQPPQGGVPGVPPVPQPPQPSYGPPSGQSMYGQRPEAPAAADPQSNYGQFSFPTPPKQPIEPLAVAGLATAPLGPVGIALGLVARGRAKQRRTRSVGMAWTAVILATLFTAGWGLAAAALTLNGTVDRALERPVEGDIEQATTIASANLAVGNCIATLPPATQVGEIQVVPCATEHIAQVVSTHEQSGDFPGEAALADLAASTCTADVEALDAGDASFVPWYLVPSEAGWATGNSRVLCLLRADAGPITADPVN